MKRFIVCLVALCLSIVVWVGEVKEARAQAAVINTFRVGATLYPVTGPLTSLASAAVMAGRWVGWGGAIMTGLQLTKILLEDYVAPGKPLAILPNPSSNPCWYSGGACNPSSSVSSIIVYSSSYIGNYSTAQAACNAMAAYDAGHIYNVNPIGVLTDLSLSCQTYYNTGTRLNLYNITTFSSCPSGYSLSGSICNLSTPSIAQWDPSQVPAPVYEPNSAWNGWQHDPRDPNAAPPSPPPTASDILRDGIRTNMGHTTDDCASGTTPVVMPSGLTCTPGPAQERVHLDPSSKTLTYSTSVQNDVTNQSWAVNNSFTTNSAATVTSSSSSTVPGPASTSSTAAPSSVPIQVDPNTGKVVVSVSSPPIVFPTDYARDATVASSNTKLDQLHKDLTTPGTSPELPTAVQTSDFTAVFFHGTFDNLVAWKLPGHDSTCPQPQLPDQHGHTFTMSSHCVAWANNAGTLSLVMVAAWTITALFIVLRA